MNDGSGSTRISLRLADGEYFPLFSHGDPDTRNLSLVPASENQEEADIHFFYHLIANNYCRWLAIYFYPKDDTPGCTTEACNFRDNIYAFKAIGASVSDAVLKKQKNEMDKCCMKVLATVFIGIDAAESVRDEKAEILYSLLAGTKLNGYFDPDHGPEHGKDAFIKVMRIFCDKDVAWPATSI